MIFVLPVKVNIMLTKNGYLLFCHVNDLGNYHFASSVICWF